MIDLRKRHLLTLLDFTPEEIAYLLDLAKRLKTDKYLHREKQMLVGKNIVLLFEKDSTRTRCSFEVAAHDQGAHVTYLGPTVLRSERRSRSKIQRMSWDVCMTVLSIVDMPNALFSYWQNFRVCQCGMA
jgi:ornithine carbamoyltransferase